MYNEDIVTHVTGMLREGEEILRKEALIRQEHQRLQHEKDKEYNKQYLETTANEWKIRVDRTRHDNCIGYTWWYLPTKDYSGFMKECYAKSFWASLDWLHEVWEGWFGATFTGMISLYISQKKKKGYFPVRYKYHEELYNDGSNRTWSLRHYASNPHSLYYTGWIGCVQGLREFIWSDMGYTPDKYPNEKEFVLWFKIENIQPNRY